MNSMSSSLPVIFWYPFIRPWHRRWIHAPLFIGRLDIAFAVLKLSRFLAASRSQHLELVSLHLFVYLKKNPNRCIALGSRPLLVDDKLLINSFHPDFLEDYPDRCEDVDPTLPKAYGAKLTTSAFFDADHAHNHVTSRSISGILFLLAALPSFGRANAPMVLCPIIGVLHDIFRAFALGI